MVVLAQSNLIKKCIGMAIFQTGIILFFISIGAKDNASIPIVAKEPVNQALGQAHAPEGSQPQAKPELAAAKAKEEKRAAAEVEAMLNAIMAAKDAKDAAEKK